MTLWMTTDKTGIVRFDTGVFLCFLELSTDRANLDDPPNTIFLTDLSEY